MIYIMENYNILNTLFDMSMNDMNDMNDINSTRYTTLLRDWELSQQRHLFGNFLLNNQDNSDILNTSLYEQNAYKNVISDEGKKQLKKIHYNSDICVNDKCPITQDEFKEGDEITILPCSHGYITNVIETWLETQCPECPICRFKLDSKEIKNDNSDDDENVSIHTSRGHFLESLNALNNIFHPFGRQQIFNTIPHSYIDNIYRSPESQLDQAIRNSMRDIQDMRDISGN